MPPLSRLVPTAPPVFRLYLFGKFRIEGESGPVRLPTRKVESLLAYLILHPIPHSREKLASFFWGDVTDAQARHSLRTALNTLRKHLGEQLILIDHETIQINPAFPVWVDASEFDKETKLLGDHVSERAITGLELYQGDLLADFYDDWILIERERYRQKYLDSLLQVTQQLRSQSRYDQAIAFARTVLAQDPANERAHQQLMFCYLASGDRTAALKQYEECRHLLQEELTVEPSPETTALYQWIRQAPLKAKQDLITNLPIPLTRFVGRRQECAQIRAMLTDPGVAGRTTRLLTLTGAGGSGKTRLAVQAVMDLLNHFKDGVWWVDLAPLVDQTLVPQTVARALGVSEKPNEPMVETLKNYLQPKQLLLLLDNCEHLVSACAQLVQALLSACPRLKILTTSREPFRLAGETVWYVPTLSVADPEHLPPLSDLYHYDGIQLFVERAAAIQPEFTLTKHNAPAVSEICQRLDGLPLAIELAAARVNVLSSQQIAARLDDRFNLLTVGYRTGLPRHQTLKAALDWSYDLLLEKEQTLLKRLSVFAGGWTLEAAEAVCVDGILSREVLDLMSRLVDKSFMLMEERDGESRYRMLETLRQYVTERLEPGEVDAIRHQYVLFFAELAEKAEIGLRGSEFRAWIERLEMEHDNFRAALDWSLNHELPEIGLRFAGALGIFWRKRGYLREGRARLEDLLAQSKDARPLLRAKAMAPAGWLVRDLGDYERAIALQVESLEIFRAAGDKLGMVEVLIQRGILAVYQNDLARAFACFRRSLALCEELDNRQGRALALVFLGHAALFNMQWDEQAKAHCEQALEVFKELDDKTEQAHAHVILGAGAHFEGDNDRARTHLEKAVQLCRQAGDKRQLGWASMVLSLTIRWQGRFDEALPVAKEALRLALELGEKTMAMNCLIYLAMFAKDRGKQERAAHLLGCAFAWGESFGHHPTPNVWATIKPDVDDLRAALGEDAYAKASAEGRAMKWEDAVDLALRIAD